jgi:integrase
MRDARGKTIRVAEGIYRRNGRHFVRVADPVTGRRGQQYADEHGFPNTKDGARALKADLEARRRRRGAGREETVDSFASRWTRDYPGKRSESTRLYNADRVKAFARDFAGRSLRDVSRVEVRAWVVGGPVPESIAETALGWQGAKRLRDGTVEVPHHRGNYQVLRTMYAEALGDGLVDANPFSNMRLEQSRGRKDIVVLTLGEIEELKRIARDKHGDYGVVLGAMIDVAAWTCMRPGEIYALTWGDIDFQAARIEVRWQLNARTRKRTRPKNGEERTIVLTPGAKDALRRVPRRIADELVFHTKRGMGYTGRVHHFYWDPIRTAFVNSLPPEHHLRQRLAANPADQLDFYELRHFGATYMLELTDDRGVPLLTEADVALQMGHRDGGKLVRETYGHRSKETQRERIARAFDAMREAG